MSIAVLRNQAREVAQRQQARLDAAANDNRDLTAEEVAAHDADTAEFERLHAQIERAEATAARLTALGTSTALNPPATVPAAPSSASRRDGRDPTDGFADLGEFATAILAATDPHGPRNIDPRLAAPTNVHTEGGDSGNTGYMVPAQFREAIWELVFEQDGLLSMVDSEPTNSNAVDMAADETTPWGATGVQAYWRSEAGQMTPSKLVTQGRTVKLHELYAFVLASEELLEDAPRLNARLTRKAAEAIAWKANDAIIYGDGVGKPLGYFNSNALVSVAKESGQAADTIVAKNVAKMFSRNLNPGRSVWQVNSDTLPELMTMTIGDQPIWTPPASGFTNAPGGFLLGRPVQFTEHAKTVGDKGDIQFVDPKGYYTPLKNGGVKYAESIHLYFDYNLRAFRWVFRMGGQPFLSAPVSPANGSNTKSHFVVLDARA